MRATLMINYLKEFVFWSGGTALYVIGVWLSITEKNAASLTCLGFGTILFLFANLDQIDYFKGFGLEAKTRRLEQQINKADELLAQLKKLSLISGEFIIESMTAGGRWDSHPANRRVYEVRRDIETQLASIGVEQPLINQALKSWLKWTAFDIAQIAIGELRSEFYRLKAGTNKEQIEIIQSFETELNAMQELPINQLVHTIEHLFLSVPLIEKSLVDQYRTNAKPWLSELTYLISNSDLPTDSLFLERNI